MEEKKEEKSKKRYDAVKNKGSSVELIQYKNDMDKIMNSMLNMHRNYGSHMILAVANEDSRKHNTHPAFVSGNTGTN